MVQQVENQQPQRPPITMKSLLEAGVHFGHQTRSWTQNEDEVASQSLFFGGTLGPDAGELTLLVDGIGKIATVDSIKLTLP